MVQECTRALLTASHSNGPGSPTRLNTVGETYDEFGVWGSNALHLIHSGVADTFAMDIRTGAVEPKDHGELFPQAHCTTHAATLLYLPTSPTLTLFC